MENTVQVSNAIPTVPNQAIDNLLFTARRGDVYGIRSILEQTPSLIALGGTDDRTALHFACAEGHVDAARVLIELGAPVNSPDSHGEKPLDDAVRGRHDKVAKLLMTQGAVLGNPSAFEHELLSAAGNTAQVQRLLRVGVSASCADQDQRSALHHAASSGNEKIVSALIRNGANIHARDRFGETPKVAKKPTQEDLTARLCLFTQKETIYCLAYAAKKKVSYSIQQQLVLSFQAGMFISIAALFATVVAHGSHGVTDDNPGLKKLLYGCVFPVGLILVVLYGGELFTGNIMVLPPAYLMGHINMKKMIRNLGVVYIGNLISSLLMAYFIAHLSGISHHPDFSSSIAHYIEEKIERGFGPVFLRAIGCNFLVCLATYISATSTDVAGKVLSIYFPTMTFAGVGFEHSIANMFLIPMGMLEHAHVSVGEFIGLSLIPSTLGNIVGGGIFVGLAAWFVYADAYLYDRKSDSVKSVVHVELTEKPKEMINISSAHSH